MNYTHKENNYQQKQQNTHKGTKTIDIEIEMKFTLEEKILS
jgi:hypothetical protein